MPESAIILGLSTRYNPFLSELHPVANIKSAKKRAKQTLVRNARNTSQRSMLRTAVKRVIKALDANDAAAADHHTHAPLPSGAARGRAIASARN